jgi:ring-1,2-phenylacetyl-CoA epoxidase subunit PaaD
MTDTENITEGKVLSVLETVMDPEVPVLSIIDLGIVRKIEVYDTASKPVAACKGVRVFITPTYTGCPAMDVINMNIRIALLEHGINNFEITTVLSPAWTTDWMSETGKQKLKAYGIAPPNIKQQVCTPGAFHEEEAVQCPHCNSYNTKLISRFGSTACKALYKCNDCYEPFDYFKCH